MKYRLVCSEPFGNIRFEIKETEERLSYCTRVTCDYVNPVFLEDCKDPASIDIAYSDLIQRLWDSQQHYSIHECGFAQFYEPCGCSTNRTIFHSTSSFKNMAHYYGCKYCKDGVVGSCWNGGYNNSCSEHSRAYDDWDDDYDEYMGDYYDDYFNDDDYYIFNSQKDEEEDMISQKHAHLVEEFDLSYRSTNR